MEDEDRDLHEFIREHFPEELQDQQPCFQWIAEQVDGHVGDLIPSLVEEFRQVARDINSRQRDLAKGLFVLLDPGDHEGVTFVKRPRGIVEKMKRSRRIWAAEQLKDVDERREVVVHGPENFLETMDDLVRFRFLCNYLSDVQVVVGELRRRYSARKEGLMLERVSDRLWMAPERRRNGHRALHLTFDYQDGDVHLKFEVQVTHRLKYDMYVSSDRRGVRIEQAMLRDYWRRFHTGMGV